MSVSGEAVEAVQTMQDTTAPKEVVREAAVATPASSQHSAPPSPCVQRKTPQTLSLDSKIPQPLASPTPLRRTGSLRVRGEKMAFGHARSPSSRGGVGVGATFPSITEASELWRKSLRGVGDGFPVSPVSPNNPHGHHGSTLRQQRHHRSLQSLSGRQTSRDVFPHTPTPSPEDLDHLPTQNFNRFLLDHAREFSGDNDDLDSLRSYGSNCSTQSACDHAQFARNGTTFSGRRMKYIVHCSSHPEPNEYLTPTQRANQQIRRLKALVEQARRDMEAKDESIFKLTKEVVELRLLRDEVDGDGSPPKKTGNVEDSPVCKVVHPLESENGNNTSLSDSGHFDDVLSLTPAQSAHSPGPRQLMSTPESERMAEVYQRRIDEITRKQGEKSLEDRKCLVEMYEKKMENMSRKSTEKYQLEKNDLIEKYEKKIGDIVKKHQEKIQEEKKSVQESYEEKIEILSNKLDTINLSQTAQHDALSKKLIEAENVVSSLTHQLDDVNTRYNDLQQELFQSRERTVTLEEEVETLNKIIATQEQELSDKRVAVVQNAQLESELQVLKRHLEEEKDNTKLKSDLETELSKALSQLQVEEQKRSELATEKTQLEAQLKQANELKSQLELKLSHTSDLLMEEQRRYEDLDIRRIQETEELRKDRELKTLFENERIQLLSSLEEEKQKRLQVEESKAEVTALYEGELKKIKDLKSNFESEVTKLQNLLSTKSQKYADLERSNNELLARKDEEIRCNLELLSQLEKDLTFANNHPVNEEQRKENEEMLKLMVQNLKEEAENHNQIIQQQVKHSEHLENEIYELRGKLEDEMKQNQNTQEKEVQELKKLLSKSQEEAEKGLHETHQLRNHIASVEAEALQISNTLEEEKHKHKDCMSWKLRAENLELEVKSLREELVETTQCLQQFSDMEEELVKLKCSLMQENERVKELLVWKSKAEDLEEEVKSLSKEAAQQEKISLFSEAVVSINDNPNSFCSPLQQPVTVKSQTTGETCAIEDVSDSTRQKICQLETEVEKLKEDLDQSCWIQSEKETSRLELEKRMQQQTIMLQKLESEVADQNQLILKLQAENNELIDLKLRLSQNNMKGSSDNESYSGRSKGEYKLTEAVIAANLHGELTNGLSNGGMTDGTTELVHQLRAEIESLKKALNDQEERHSEMNLKMYLKGQEAAKFERRDQVLEMAAQAPEKISVPELLTQLTETERELDKVKDNQLENMPNSSLSLLSASEAVCLYLLGSVKALYRQLAEGQANNSSSPEATLLFLKSAFYYFLTDEANCQGHLHAIQSILGFTESEKQSIETLTYIRR